VSGSNSGDVYIWNAKNGILIQEVEMAKKTRIKKISWSPDGSLLAVAREYSSEIIIWDVTSGQLLHQIDQNRFGSVYNFSWSPDSSLLASVDGDEYIRIWNIRTGNLLWKTKGGNSDSFGVHNIAWSPDGEHLAAVGRDFGMEGVVNIFAVANDVKLVQVMEGFTGFGSKINWMPDGKSLLTLSDSSPFYIWDIETGSKRQILDEHFGPILSIDWSADGDRIAIAEMYGIVRILDAKNLTVLQSFYSDNHGTTIKWFVDGKRLLSFSINTGVTRVWDADTGTTLVELKHINETGERLSPDGKLRFQNTVGKILVWDTESDELLVSLETIGPWPGQQTWSQDEKKIVLWGFAVYPTIASILKNKGEIDEVERELSLPYFIENGTVAWSPNSEYLAIGESGVFHIWDVDKGQMIASLDVADETIRAISWSPDGKMLVTGSNYGTIRIWGIPEE
jgi:WD40 repeat protein